MAIRIRPLLALAAAALLSLAPTIAEAQRGPFAPGPGPGRGPTHAAGQFDYYSLVLSWSPTFCAANPGYSDDPQCSRRAPRPYAFVLHGLWPQYERGFPESCPTRDRPFVPDPLIRRMLDIMPSPRLVIHEYRKHGTCSGLDPQGYFDLARKLHDEIKVPARFLAQSDGRGFTVSPGEVVQEFVAANPGLKSDQFAVVCGGPGNQLRELRFCFAKSGERRACGQNENPRRLCQAGRLFVPPVRLGAASPPPSKGPPATSPPASTIPPGAVPLPGPKGLPPPLPR